MTALPNDEIVKALEEAALNLAAAARKLSLNLSEEISGREALMIFADAIDSANAKLYRKAGAA